MMDKIKIIFANAAIKNGNLGCVALSISTMFLLDELFKKKGVKYEFYLPDSGFRYNELGTHEISVGDKTISYKAIWDVSLSGCKSKIKNLLLYKKTSETKGIYKSADFIIDIGQGDSFADIYGKGRFDYIFSDYKQGHKYNIPYCVLPQTIGPFKDTQICNQAKLGLNWAKTIMVRDSQSLNCVDEMFHGERTVHEIIDMAFFMPFERHQFVSDYIHVGLNISSLMWNGGYTQNNQFGLKVDYKKLIDSILKYFLSNERVTVHLIPHVVGYDDGIENDYAVSYAIFHQYSHPRLLLSPLFRSPIDAKNYISGMDFFMGARMHSTIGAFSAGVPVVPMAYSRKFNGLFQDTLKYEAMVDMKAQDNDEVLDSIIRSFGERDKLKKMIEQRLNGVVAERRKLLMNELSIFFHLDK